MFKHFFFFFQAEDGIRDYKVTGVQTCALPIYGAAPSLPASFHQAIDGIEIGPRTTPCGAAAHSGESVIVSDITTDPAWAHNKALALQYGLRACWSVPIKASTGRVLGTFALYDRKPRLPTASDLEVLDRAQHLAGIMLERDIAETNLRRTGERLRLVARARNVMAECNRVLVRATAELQLLQDMCRILVEKGGYRIAWVGLVRHDEGSTIEPVASAGDHDGYLASIRLSWADAEFGQGPSGRAVRSGEPQIVHDIGTDPKFVQWRKAALARGDRKAATLPLKGEGETIGVVSIHAGEAH